MIMRRWFKHFVRYLVKGKIYIKIFACSMKTFTTAQDCSESHIIISELASHSVIGSFFPVSTPHWMQKNRVNIHVLDGFRCYI